MGYLGRLDEALDRSRSEHDSILDVGRRNALNTRQFGDLPKDEPGADVGWTDSVHRHAMFARLERGSSGQPDKTVLRGDIRRLIGRRHNPVDGRDVDDSTPSLSVHVWQRAAHEEERSGQVHSDHKIPLILWELVNRRNVLHSRGVDEDVHASVARNGGFDCLPAFRRRRDIESQGRMAGSRAIEPGDNSLGGLEVHVSHDDARPCGRELQHNGSAYLAAAASHEGDPAGQFLAAARSCPSAGIATGIDFCATAHRRPSCRARPSSPRPSSFAQLVVIPRGVVDGVEGDRPPSAAPSGARHGVPVVEASAVQRARVPAGARQEECTCTGGNPVRSVRIHGIRGGPSQMAGRLICVSLLARVPTTSETRGNYDSVRDRVVRPLNSNSHRPGRASNCAVIAPVATYTGGAS